MASSKFLKFIHTCSLQNFPESSRRRDVGNLYLSSLQCGNVLRSLTNSRSLSEGQKLHAHMVISGILHGNTYLDTKLAAFYACCSRMGEAQVIFDDIVLKNSFLWNSMIRGYASCDSPLKALALYREMSIYGQRPDHFTYPFVLKACGQLSSIDFGRIIHGEVVVNGLASDVYVSNSLLSMYSKSGYMEHAREVFDGMLVKDLTSWNTMILGYAKNNEPGEAVDVFRLMTEAGFIADGTTLLGLLTACAELKAMKQGKEVHAYAVRNGMEFRNNYVVNAIISMYCNCNYVPDARQLFESMKTDTVSWNLMISGNTQVGDAVESTKLFCQMIRENASPDEVTTTVVLGACDQINALQFGMSVHSLLTKKGFAANAYVGSALVDMYSKCGSLVCARLAFDEQPEKNLVLWSSIISGYGFHGRGREALSTFHDMISRGINPDEAVLTSVLSACSHAGLIGEGKEIFKRIREEFNLKPTLAHYSCLVDLLGRSGKLDEAHRLFETLEVNPTTDMWITLLSACRFHKNVELAELAAERIFNMNPGEVTGYIILSNIYAAERRWLDVERVRTMMRERGLKKLPGGSFVEVDKVMHWFLVGDKTHEQSEEIYAKLKDLKEQLMNVGYKPDTSSVLYDVEEEVKEKMLWDHSEKLALAFALITNRPGSVIRITKNLRTCDDCHTVTKLISKITGTEVIMRDIRRFHHFKDGYCSCGDYW